MRSEVARKERDIEELQKRERELLHKHEQIKSDMARVRQQVTKVLGDWGMIWKQESLMVLSPDDSVRSFEMQ